MKASARKTALPAPTQVKEDFRLSPSHGAARARPIAAARGPELGSWMQCFAANQYSGMLPLSNGLKNESLRQLSVPGHQAWRYLPVRRSCLQISIQLWAKSGNATQSVQKCKIPGEDSSKVSIGDDPGVGYVVGGSVAMNLLISRSTSASLDRNM